MKRAKQQKRRNKQKKKKKLKVRDKKTQKIGIEIVEIKKQTRVRLRRPKKIKEHLKRNLLLTNMQKAQTIYPKRKIKQSNFMTEQ